MSLRYVTIESVRTACGITTKFITDADMSELLEYMEEEIEQFINTRFQPFTVIEQHNGNDSERLILRHNPVLKIRQLNIDGTDQDLDAIRCDSEPGIIWLTTEAAAGSFITKSTERNLIRIKYDYGLLEKTTTQTTTDAAELEGDSVVIAVADATSFEADDYIEITGMDSMKEVTRISSITDNNITVDNLSTGHEAGSLITRMRVPKVAERLMLVACSMAAVARVVGQSFDEITGYSLSELSVQKGEPYTQWREVTTQLQKEYNKLLTHFRIRPSIF